MAEAKTRPELPFDPPSQAWLHATARAVEWFDRQVDRAGRLEPDLHDLAAYYKWPLALCGIGRLAQADEILQIIADDFMDADGDFRTSTEKSRDPLYGLIAESYTNTWPIVAARVLDRPEIAHPALECLRDRRVEETGGFLTGFATQHADRRQDIVTIAGCGNAFLAWGELFEAIGAGECLNRILAMQEGAGNPFRLYIDGAGMLMTPDEIPERLAFIRLDQPDQAYVYLGMAAVFLARLYAVTGDVKFLAGAEGYFAVNQACGEAVYSGTGCCKTGWAAATLFRLTRRPEYGQSARRAAAELLSCQEQDGSWQVEGGSALLNCDATGELAYHLAQYCTELAAGQGRTS